MQGTKARRSGRPRRQEAISRDTILTTAARLFRRHGYQATTVRDIASAVGIRPGSLFHHFASKEQLLVEMLREASISLCVGAESAIQHESACDSQLVALIQYELNCLVGDHTRYQYSVLVSEWRDVPDAVRPELKRLGERYYDVWREVLRRCDEAGLLRVEPYAALKILHGINRGAMLWFRQEGRYTIPEFTQVLANLILTRPEE